MDTYEKFTHSMVMCANVYPQPSGETKPWQEHTSRKQKKKTKKKKEKSSERKLHNI